MTKSEITAELERQRKLLLNYEELEVDMEDDAAYVARGNGFCDAKYSEDFLEGQIDKIRTRISELENLLAEWAVRIALSLTKRGGGLWSSTSFVCIRKKPRAFGYGLFLRSVEGNAYLTFSAIEPR